MKALIALLCFIITGPACWSQWALVAREPQQGPAGVQFAKVELTNADGQRAEVHVVAFHPKAHTLAVIDNPDGSKDLAAAAQEKGALAAVNGGYFHPDRTPLGLVISAGKTVHPQERAKLLSGLVVARGGGVSLLRVAEFKANRITQDALQAGPFLVDAGKPVAGLNTGRNAARTVICTTSDGRAALLVCRYATLADTAEILVTAGLFPDGGKIIRALNLDGGSSTGLWVRAAGDSFYLREGKDVRNFVAIVPRR